jgi:hypothetical protein
MLIINKEHIIASHFLEALPRDEGDHGSAVAERGDARFSMMREATDEAVDANRCRDALAPLMPGGYLAVALELPHGSRFRRLAGALGLPFGVARAERALARGGAELAGRYGVAPDLDAPTVVYQLGGAAARYAEENLLLGRRSWPVAALCWTLRLWTGCDPSLGAILVVGRKP